MNFVAWFPQELTLQISHLLATTPVPCPADRGFTSQIWVRLGLHRLQEAHILNLEQTVTAVQGQQRAIDAPYTTIFPTTRRRD
jgi:hypothetical protein